MADLNDLEAAQAVKLVGASTSGTENQFIDSYNNQLQSADFINTSAIQTTLTIGTTAVECKVGASNLVNRKMLLVQINATGYSYGFNSGSQPFTVSSGEKLTFAIGPNISIWIKKSSASGTVTIAELS